MTWGYFAKPARGADSPQPSGISCPKAPRLILVILFKRAKLLVEPVAELICSKRCWLFEGRPFDSEIVKRSRLNGRGLAPIAGI